MDAKNVALFVGGVIFGSAGFKILASDDAKKAYVHGTAAALRMKASAMESMECLRENCADIKAEAIQLNEKREAAKALAEDFSEDK